MSSAQQLGPTLMVVDDSRANLQLLGSLFRQHGYRVRPFTQGKFALQGAISEPPDLFLLDVNMPEMDGYEICAKLKEDPKLRNIPVIFLSTLTNPDDKVKAFKSGAVDYVTKQPFSFEEILARVDTHIRLNQLQTQLQQQNFELKESYEQLSKLEVMRDKLIHMVVHDMRSPMTVIRMSLEMLKNEVKFADQDHQSCVEMSFKSSTTLLDMINQLLDISRLQAGQMPLNRQPVDIQALTEAQIAAIGPLSKNKKISLIPDADNHAFCDSAITSRVIANLIGNAVKFTPEGGTIQVILKSEPTEFRIAVQDTGPGIPLSEQERIFEMFAQVAGEKQKLGSGLGLSFCRLAVKAHGGNICVSSEPGKGCTFWFTLPKAQMPPSIPIEPGAPDSNCPST